ncbi:MAG: hypothetical protein ORO03_09335 [Alphaproteobacteria bacterium]|nr:hypothetical protein [Alphaproteobacteria bacterium]
MQAIKYLLVGIVGVMLLAALYLTIRPLSVETRQVRMELEESQVIHKN